MKTYFQFFSIFLLLIFSINCSSDDGGEDTSLPVSQQPEEPKVVSYQITINSSDGGTVNVSSGSYEEGTVLEITATPSEGYVFSNWTGFDSTDSTITINVNQVYDLNAVLY